MVRGLQEEATQGGGGAQALWEDGDGTGDVRVQGAESRLCVWNAVRMGTVPGDKLEREAEAHHRAPWRPVKDFLFFLLNAKLGSWLLGNRET